MRVFRTVTASLTALAVLTLRAEAQKTHRVLLEADRDKDVYRFSPSRLTVASGDVIVFTAATGAPHGVVFESKGLSAAAKAALATALGNRRGEPTGPTLTKDGATYRFVVPALPAGSYAFFCLPHRAYDMRGEMTVEK